MAVYTLIKLMSTTKLAGEGRERIFPLPVLALSQKHWPRLYFGLELSGTRVHPII